MSANDQP